MGLKSGEHGVKALLRRTCSRGFHSFDTLVEARDAVLKPALGSTLSPGDLRARTVVFLDGNVLMMGVPEAVMRFGDFCDVVYNRVRDAMRAGRLVVLAFDEPEVMTLAKKEEQARRDAARASRAVVCSTDMEHTPTMPGDLTVDQLHAMPDVHVLKNDRAARSRLYDEVVRCVYLRLEPLMKHWESLGHDAGVFVLDGVEPRGAARARGERRQPVMQATCATVLDALARDDPIGEGDMKLMALENRVRELAGTHKAFAQYKLCITLTIDTDTFMTMMIDAAKRRLSPYPAPMWSLFAMREPVSKRQREEDPGARATFLTCDVELLEALVQQHLWSKTSGKGANATNEQKLHAVLALTSAAALAGCDFTLDGLKGSRFDHMWEVLPQFVAEEPQALAQFGSALASDPVVARTACKGLYRVCVAASAHMETKPRYKKQSQSVFDVSDQLLLRAIWAAAYATQPTTHPLLTTRIVTHKNTHSYTLLYTGTGRSTSSRRT